MATSPASPTNFENPGSMAVNALGQTNFNQDLANEFFTVLGRNFRANTKSAANPYGVILPFNLAEFVAQPQVWRDLIPQLTQQALQLGSLPNQGLVTTRQALGLPANSIFGEYTNEFNKLMETYRQNNAAYYGRPSTSAPVPFTPNPTIISPPPASSTAGGVGPVLTPAGGPETTPRANFDAPGGATITPGTGSRTINTRGPQALTPSVLEQRASRARRGNPLPRLQGILGRGLRSRTGTSQGSSIVPGTFNFQRR